MGCFLVLLAVAFWRPIQQKFTAYLLLQSDAPSEEVLSETVDHASDPGELLIRLWETEKLPHREFVVSYISRVSSGKPELFSKLEQTVLDAANDPDVEVRQAAFATLQRLKHSHLRRLAIEQLHDSDPAVRLIGLQALRSIANSNDVPVAIRFLEDPEPRVVVAAVQVLRQVTGQDFGIKLTHAMPQFTSIGTNPPSAPDLAAIQRGVQQWHDWWAAHQNDYPVSEKDAHESAQWPARSLATSDFKLQNTAGNPTSLSEFIGKSVLLVFWSPDAPASLDDTPALNALQKRYPEQLAILGICIPAAPSCADEHEHSHNEGGEHAHHHHDAEGSAAPKTADQFRVAAQQATDRLKIEFPMLVDPKGSVGAHFKVEERPTYILVDTQARTCRRLVGFRAEQALTAIVESVAERSQAKH